MKVKWLTDWKRIFEGEVFQIFRYGAPLEANEKTNGKMYMLYLVWWKKDPWRLYFFEANSPKKGRYRQLTADVFSALAVHIPRNKPYKAEELAEKLFAAWLRSVSSSPSRGEKDEYE